jgi:DNA-binding MarR family transcriptional regulator
VTESAAAEASLARRRQTECGPSENARAAMRFVFERADEGKKVTPRAIAAHLGVTAAAVSGILDKLRAGGLIAFVENPDDRRSKHVVPFDRDADVDEIDPLTARIRDAAAELDAATARAVAAFIDQITQSVDAECR